MPLRKIEPNKDDLIKIIGINIGHDGGSCLLIDGEIKYSISEERLNRRKYSSGWLNSLDYCLEASGLELSDIDLVVFSSYGKNLPKNFDGGLTKYGFDKRKCITVDHHLSHAYSAFLLSPFNKAIVLVSDGEGNRGKTESYYIGRGNKLKEIGGNLPLPSYKGLGRTYEAFTNFLGWKDIEAGKTMGLAAFGNPKRFEGVDLFKVKDLKIVSKLDSKYDKGVMDFARKNNINFGCPYKKDKTQLSRDIAYLIQNRLESASIELVNELYGRTRIKNLCFAGGVALNCNANYKILTNTPIENVFIPPFANDRGQPIGNALYGYYKFFNKSKKSSFKNDYLGRNYSKSEIYNSISRKSEMNIMKIAKYYDLEFHIESNIAKIAAELIAKGNVIGWFQGRSEFGPRALGNRSILADPRKIETKTVLDKIKKRESFRPYSPSVLGEYVNDFFCIDFDSPFMLFTVKVKEDKRKVIPAVVHVDGTSRIQTVKRSNNMIFYDLIKEFFGITGIPLVLNTSFNIAGEPIVETPADAIECFLKTGLKFLIMKNYLINKKS